LALARLKSKSNAIRQDVLRVAVKNNAGHIAPSLSCIEILVALYYQVMTPEDKLIFSKAHGCYGLYSILTDKGIMSRERWENFDLPGCLERMPKYGILAGCGALGHGLPIAVGLAYGAKLRKENYHVFCIVGDGETQEGSTWEAIQFAVKHKLNNLIIIIDDNGLQAMDFRIKILDIVSENIERRLQGFGLNPIRCDGHDTDTIARVLSSFKQSFSIMPHVLIAKTVKGKGVKCMENVAKWHFRVPDGSELPKRDNLQTHSLFH